LPPIIDFKLSSNPIVIPSFVARADLWRRSSILILASGGFNMHEFGVNLWRIN
jgi:hypothetical protein